jgi:hypothetical protein
MQVNLGGGLQDQRFLSSRAGQYTQKEAPLSTNAVSLHSSAD